MKYISVNRTVNKYVCIIYYNRNKPSIREKIVDLIKATFGEKS